MAMTMKTDGLDELSRMLYQLGEQAEGIAAKALYQGADVMANRFSSAAAQIRTEPFKGKRDHRLPSPEEKAALQGKTGIARFNKNGSEVDTVVGISRNAGYVTLGNRKTAVIEIARSINSGTSFMKKQPVFRKAASGGQAAATGAIVAKAEELLKQITEQ